MNFTNNLRSLRLMRGMTMQEVADVLGVTRQYVNTLEKSTHPPTKALEGLCELYGCTPNDILLPSTMPENGVG